MLASHVKRILSMLSPNDVVRRGCIQVMEGRHCFGHLTVEENLLVASEHVTVASALRDLFGPQRPPDRTGVDWAISVCGLEDVAGRYPSEISLGRRKLVGIGRALARQPRLVLLDEPAAGLEETTLGISSLVPMVSTFTRSVAAASSKR